MFLSHALRFNLWGGSFNLVRFMSGPLISRVVFGPPSRAPAVSHSIFSAHRGHRQKLIIVNVSRLISNNYTGVFSLWCRVPSVFSSLTSLDTLNMAAGPGHTHWDHSSSYSCLLLARYKIISRSVLQYYFRHSLAVVMCTTTATINCVGS